MANSGEHRWNSETNMRTLCKRLPRRRRSRLLILCGFGILTLICLSKWSQYLRTGRISQGTEPQEQDNVPESLKGLIESLDSLSGRHSDFVNSEPCTDRENKFQWNTSKEYDFVGPFKYLSNYTNPCFLNKRGTLKCVPYFYVIGVPKAGTTDIFNRITSHPQVLRGNQKEIRWFDRRRFGQAMPDNKHMTFEEYLDNFSSVIKQICSFNSIKNGIIHCKKVLGDGGPTYYYSSQYWKQVPGNEGCSEPRVTSMSHIHHLWPEAKLVLILRNPVVRLYSSYLFNANATGAKRTPEEFHEWVELSMNLWQDCLSNYSFRYCMYDGKVEWHSKLWELHIGQYSRYILDILRIFPRKQLMVVHLEDYSINTEKWLKQIFAFLELEPLTDRQIKNISMLQVENENSIKRSIKPMLDTTRKVLENFFAPFNEELSDIMKNTLYLWLPKNQTKLNTDES